MFSRLAGKRVLITGASSGMGLASANLFASAGCHLILGARRVEKLNETRTNILASSPNVKIHVAHLDVTSEQSVDTFMKGIPKELAEVDVLLNNAGLALHMQSLWEYKLEDVMTIMDTNFKGAFLMMKAVVPGMVARNRGHIINLSSLAGVLPYKNASIYCASKHALEALNESLRKELVQTKVRVSSITPGLVETNFAMVRYQGDAEKAKATYKGITPLTPEDCAEAVVWVASRPDHMVVTNMSLMPVHQASSEIVHRN
jgi:NADP-dependent 3-hydroxy acid dehydrogenase YdfG